jgi:aspartate carbamoyltransferase regulatory subunit
MGKKMFTLLEDEHPTKAFLNIESRKMGYHDIVKLNIDNPKHTTSNEQLEKVGTTNQEEIKKARKC